jgi:hypothetical protein
MQFDGADRIRIDASGDLLLHTSSGVLRQRKPVVYQEVDGVRRHIDAAYQAIEGRRQVAFRVGRYDRARVLVIDPVLVYSTFLGGSSSDLGWSLATGADGSAYVAGFTTSANYPTADALDPTLGSHDGFVTKLSPSGTSLVYSTYIGGTGQDEVHGVAVDSSGHAYVTGYTLSTDLPVTPGAFDTTPPTNAIDHEAFVLKLQPSGSALVYGTYLGHVGTDVGEAVTADASGNAYITGSTTAAGFPATAGAFDAAMSGGSDAFIAKLDPSGATLLYATFLGGSMAGLESGTAIAVDAEGQSHVVGFTRSTDFPTTSGAVDITYNGGDNDIFVAKLNAAGSALVFSTYLGGALDDRGNGIAVGNGSVYVAGRTFGMPTTAGAFDTIAASTEGFVTRLDHEGTTLGYATYLGGTSSDAINAIAVNAAGEAYVTGATNSSDFPLTPDAIDTTFVSTEGFVAKLDAAGGSLLYSTLLGGGSSEEPRGIGVDPTGNVIVAGFTSSADFPVTPGAFQTIKGAQNDAFVTLLDFERPAITASSLDLVYFHRRMRIVFSEPIDPATFTTDDGFIERIGAVGTIPLGSVTALSATEFEITFAALSEPNATYVVTLGPDIRDVNGNQMAAAVPIQLTTTRPTLNLKINGLDPSPPVVTTTGPMSLTLAMSGNPIPVDWYWMIVFDGQVFWVTAGGLSPTPAPVATAPTADLNDVQLLNFTLPPGTTFVSAFFLVEGTQIVASDAIAAVVGPTAAIR